MAIKKKKSQSRSKLERQPQRQPLASSNDTVTAVKGIRKQSKDLKVLNTDTRKRLPKPREGAEQHVRRMARLLRDRSDALVLPGVLPHEVEASWERSAQLLPLRAELMGFV